MKFEEGKNKVVNQTKICNDNVLFIMVGIINCGFHGHATIAATEFWPSLVIRLT
jgi:hypothetical protein